MIDVDGSFNHSGIVPLENKSVNATLSIAPNPVKNILKLTHPKAIAGANIATYAVNGQQLYRKIILLNAQQTEIDLGKFEAGLYVLKYYNNQETKTIRLEKL